MPSEVTHTCALVNDGILVKTFSRRAFCGGNVFNIQLDPLSGFEEIVAARVFFLGFKGAFLDQKPLSLKNLADGGDRDFKAIIG